MYIKKNCPFCGEETQLYVKDEQMEAYNSGQNIMQAFNDIDEFGREFIISGICYACQERVFHKPLKQHEALWGSLLGECDNCGSNIYELKDRQEDGSYKCPSCYTHLNLVNGILEGDYDE